MNRLFWPLLLVSFIFAGEYFSTPYTLWADGDYLLWTPDETLPLSPNEFCQSLKRNNSGIGSPNCREIGEWQRDTISQLYGNWLSKNLGPKINAEQLKARSPMMSAKITSLEDKIVLFLTKENESVKLAIFDETSNAPKTAGSVPFSTNKNILADQIVMTYFDHDANRRLTKAERRKKAEEPDPYFQETKKMDFWVGANVGYSQAEIPLTPHNWYKNKLNSRVKRYRVTKDSLSLWNFLEDEALVLSAYFGATWYGIFGGEIFYKYSGHDVKTDKNDTTYRELDSWKFGIHDIGLTLHVTHSFNTTEWLEISPFAYFGFQYSFLAESIELKKGVKKPSAAYNSRIEFEDVYKGAILGIGSRFLFKKNFGFVVRTGITTRGRSEDTTPDPNAVAEPTIIGGLTVDGFVNAGIEYHWNWK